MAEPKTAKKRSAPAATSLRLPRSARMARGTAQSSWATWATNAVAANAVLWMWKECSRFLPMMATPLLNVPGTMAAAVSSTSGAHPLARKASSNGGALPSPVPGTRAMSATASSSECLATASLSSSSGTAKSKRASAWSTTAEAYP